LQNDARREINFCGKVTAPIKIDSFRNMTAPIIGIPNQFTGLTLAKVAADVVAIANEGWPPKLVFDFAQLRFIRPAGVVFLSNLVHWLREKGCNAAFRNIDGESRALFFLDDSLFFEQHLGSKVRATASPRETTRPLLKIAQKDSHNWLEFNLVPWLAGRLSITPSSLYSVKASVSELFNNIQDHTRYDIGSIFVQHFPNEQGITISLSDFGLGIPTKVRERVPRLSDSDAIIQAVQEGFTTRSTPGNKGAGLDYLLRTVVVGNGGQVTIYSQRSIVRFHKVGTQAKPISFQVGYCPGTTIDINLRTDTIEILPDESEELQW
jgi:anti-sigma regulatory factor (Ser/Thr protein kinase)